MAGEWPVLSLREAGVQLLDCEHRTPPPAAAGYPYVAIPQVKDGRLDLSDARFISHDHFIEWTRKACPQKWDVILSRRCNPGDTAVVPSGLQCALGQNLVLLRADGKGVLPEFLRWLVRGPRWWEQVQTFINVGAVFDSLKCADIPSFRLPIPPLEDQRAIAHILGTLDDKIELNRRMNETLETIAWALFKSWFVDFLPVRAKMAARTQTGDPVRLPAEGSAQTGAKHALSKVVRAEGRPSTSSGQAIPGLPEHLADLFPDSFEDSELGEIPKGWEVSSVDEQFNLTMGQSPPGETYNEFGDGLPFYQGRADFTSRFPARRVYCTAPTRFAKASDTLVSVRAPVGDINMAVEDCAIGRGVAAVRHKTGSRSYTYQFMCSLEEVFARFEAEGTVFGSIGKKDFHAIPCIVPPRLLVRAFEHITSPVDDRIENCERESQALAALRDSLLPKLISGEIRVKELDKTAVTT